MKKIIYTTLLFLVFSTNATFAFFKPYNNTIAKDIASQSVDLKPKVVKLALEAFENAKKSGVKVKKPFLTVIDYTLPSTKKRLWVVDLATKKILHSSLVAHGKNSGENYTTAVSNRTGSLQTSVGLFLTEDTYTGRCGYSLRLQGLEKGFNDKAKARTIVMHGAPYVNKEFADQAGRLGRSWGCPAIERKLVKPVINTIKGGSLIFSYHNHPQWLSQSKFINNQA